MALLKISRLDGKLLQGRFVLDDRRVAQAIDELATDTSIHGRNQPQP